jgi:hypothetical protein
VIGRFVLAAALMFCLASPVAAQVAAMGKPAVDEAERNLAVMKPSTFEPRYIIGPKGSSLRIVGPRFLPDPTKRLSFPGRPSTGQDGP